MSRVITTFTTESSARPRRASRPPAALLLPLFEDAMRAARCWQGSEQDWHAPPLGAEPEAPSQKMAGEPNVRTVATLGTGSTPLLCVRWCGEYAVA
jgi:hypothetical protein